MNSRQRDSRRGQRPDKELQGSSSGEADPAPVVFISYMHESAQLDAAVQSTHTQLRRDGVDAHMDVWVTPNSWPQWMLRSVQSADFVLVVCTQTYCEVFEGARPAPGTRLGGSWESFLITQQLYEARGDSDKFIPVVYKPADTRSIPLVLRGSTYYDLSTADGYERLYARITNQAPAAPPLGRARAAILHDRLPALPLEPTGRSLTYLMPLVPTSSILKMAVGSLLGPSSEGELMGADLADLDADGFDELVALRRVKLEESDSQEWAVVVDVWHYSWDRAEWATCAPSHRVSEVHSDAWLEMMVAALGPDGRQYIVVTTTQGSGAYLDFEVLALEGGSLRSIYQSEPAFQGLLANHGGSLTLRTGGLTRLVELTDGHVQEIPVVLTGKLPLGTRVIEYSIIGSKVVCPKSVKLRLGQTLALVRSQLLGHPERVMWRDDGILLSEEMPAHDRPVSDVWRATSAGQTTIQIVPDGYDWAHAHSLKVKVRPTRAGSPEDEI